MLGGSTVPIEITDADLADAVSAEAEAMEEVLRQLVEAPTTLGNEEPGQAVVRDAFRAVGLEPRDIPLDPEQLRARWLMPRSRGMCRARRTSSPT